MEFQPRLAQVISVGPPALYGHRVELDIYADNWVYGRDPQSRCVPPHEYQMLYCHRSLLDLAYRSKDVVAITTSGNAITDIVFINHDTLGGAIREWYPHEVAWHEIF